MNEAARKLQLTVIALAIAVGVILVAAGWIVLEVQATARQASAAAGQAQEAAELASTLAERVEQESIRADLQACESTNGARAEIRDTVRRIVALPGVPGDRAAGIVAEADAGLPLRDCSELAAEVEAGEGS